MSCLTCGHLIGYHNNGRSESCTVDDCICDYYCSIDTLIDRMLRLNKNSPVYGLDYDNVPITYLGMGSAFISLATEIIKLKTMLEQNVADGVANLLLPRSEIYHSSWEVTQHADSTTTHTLCGLLFNTVKTVECEDNVTCSKCKEINAAM